ncbi:Cupin domain [Pannonibacter indicus]|uniref:Cupin domain n=2 Tax=Pannonibacter indicus TaxID=466044 RepID=A0A0K6HVL5_9HYPH|nr:Cupin domain [Pannonibacter indicus]
MVHQFKNPAGEAAELYGNAGDLGAPGYGCGRVSELPRNGLRHSSARHFHDAGEVTGWHQHHCPVFCYVLEGEITVTYQGGQTRLFRQGECMVDVMRVTHQGENTGQSLTRILTVFLNGDGLPEKAALPEPDELKHSSPAPF